MPTTPKRENFAASFWLARMPEYSPLMARVLSAIQPSGDLHLGNYLGALSHWVAAQDDNDAIYAVMDLHALTLEIDPAELRRRTIETLAGLIAIGLDPKRCSLFVQSHVSEHSSLTWLLECTASFGELTRMTQFKAKSEGRDSVRASLLTYPVLMAADILLYDTEQVPVGDDQRQHLELARNLAERFNARYGQTFVIPEAVVPKVAARIMDLQEPTQKMSKSTGTPLGTIALFDPPEEIERKVRRAVTDSSSHVSYDRDLHPGASNLLEILASIQSGDPASLAESFPNYGSLKAATAEALCEHLRPMRERYFELLADPGELHEVIAKGAAKVRPIAARTLSRARAAMGLTEIAPQSCALPKRALF